ncbi:MAG: hypothetical protein AAGA20_13665 [Planctomycetota bacterium]
MRTTTKSNAPLTGFAVCVVLVVGVWSAVRRGADPSQSSQSDAGRVLLDGTQGHSLLRFERLDGDPPLWRDQGQVIRFSNFGRIVLHPEITARNEPDVQTGFVKRGPKQVPTTTARLVLDGSAVEITDRGAGNGALVFDGHVTEGGTFYLGPSASEPVLVDHEIRALIDLIEAAEDSK